MRAAIDVGTNSFRLLVVDHDGRQLVRELDIVRIGQGVDRSGRLADEAIERALPVVERYRDTWRSFGVADHDVVMGATSAVRDATDRERFLGPVRELAPELQVRVLSGEQEAANAFAGAVAALPDLPRPVVVLDVGGGSTELVLGDLDDRVVASTSLQLGSVRLTERFLPGDPPHESQVLAALAEIRARVGEGVAALGPDVRAAASLVGVAGTATTLAAVVGGLGEWRDGYVHGRRLTLDEVLTTSHELLLEERAAIAARPEVHASRADVINGGVLVLRGCVEGLRSDHLVISEGDGLDALVLR